MTAQIITLIVLAVIAIIAYVGVNYTKSESGRLGYSFLSLFIMSILFLIITVTLTENVEMSSKLKNKCPEYEKVENVYKLKQ